MFVLLFFVAIYDITIIHGGCIDSPNGSLRVLLNYPQGQTSTRQVLEDLRLQIKLYLFHEIILRVRYK